MSFHSLPLDTQVRWNVPIVCRWDIHLRDVLIRKLQYVLIWDPTVKTFFFAREQMSYNGSLSAKL